MPGTGRLPFASSSLMVRGRGGAPGMLTKRQKELLDFLRTYIAEHGYAPTLDEIGRHFALGSLATVHKHLTNLERKGRIRRLANHSRALELTEVPAAGAAVAVPLLGRVAAGAPIEAVQVPETLTLPPELLGRGEDFAPPAARGPLI